jgi:hypothetical protein
VRQARPQLTWGLFILLLWGPPRAAWASCGAASCPLDTADYEAREAGWVRLGYQWEYLDQDAHRLGRRSASFGEVRGHHDEEFTLNRIQRLTAAAGLTDRLSTEAKLPIISRSHAHVHHHQGEELLESWDITGVGDMALLIRYAFWTPAVLSWPTLSAIVGGEFPTGEHDAENGEGGEAEPAIQPGSNSYDLILGASSLQTFMVPTLTGQYAELAVIAGFQVQFNGPGNDDYRLGDSVHVNLGTSYPLTRRLGVMTQLNVLIRDRDGIGLTREEVEKTGGEFVYLSPGLEWRPAEGWRVVALIQLPIYQRVNSLQTASDYNVLLGVEYTFQLGDERRPRRVNARSGRNAFNSQFR